MPIIFEANESGFESKQLKWIKATLVMNYFRSYSEQIFTLIWNKNNQLHLALSVWYVSRLWKNLVFICMLEEMSFLDQEV